MQKSPEILVEYEDAPMTCCGMAMGWGLTNEMQTGKMVKRTAWDNSTYETPEARVATKDDVKARLQKLKDTACDNSRNCLMISVSSHQEQRHQAKTAAEEEGFRVIQEFYNPNSGNQVFIMTYTRFANFDEYEASEEYEDEDI